MCGVFQLPLEDMTDKRLKSSDISMPSFIVNYQGPEEQLVSEYAEIVWGVGIGSSIVTQ